MLLPSALGFSPHPPVSVYGTGTARTIAAFLGTRLTRFPTLSSVHIAPSPCRTVFPARQVLRLYAASHSAPAFPACVPTVLSYRSTGISTCCPSTTPFGLALGPDLPRADQLYSGNLGYSAGRIPTFLSLHIRPEGFPPSSRYSFRHSLFNKLHSSFRYCFAAYSMLLYQPSLVPRLRRCVSAPDIFGAGPLDQ